MEPLSIVVSSISLLTFIVNTFAGQLENINGRMIDYRKCIADLEGYKSTLEEYEEQLKQWEIVWCRALRQPFDNETYDFLWGAVGHKLIRKQANNITNQFKEIIAIFCFRHANSAGFNWDSDELPEDLRGGPGSRVWKYNNFLSERKKPENPRLFRKFAFAIYKNTEIKYRVDRLDTSIKDLTKTSKRYFYQRHDIRAINPPTGEDVARAWNLYFERNKFLKFFNHIRRLHDEQLVKEDAFGWELVFAQAASARVFMTISTPDCQFHEGTLENAVDALLERGHLVCTLYTENFEADYDAQVIHSTTISVSYPSDCPSPNGPDDLAARMLQWNQGGNRMDVASCRSFADDNAHWIKMRDDLRFGLDPRTNKATSVFREILQYYQLILTSAGIARSMVFFYGTSWLRNLCVCQILRARPTLSPLRELITRWPLDHDPKPGLFDNCGHLAKGLRYLTFLSLGVFLAEMAIVAPIEIVVNENGNDENRLILNGDVRFNLPRRVRLPTGMQNPLTASELVLHLEQLKPRIGALHVGKNYTKAVEKCFETRALFIDRRSGKFKAGDLDRCIHDIVKPLEVHCAALEAEYRKLAQQRWFRDAVEREDL